MEIAMDIHFPHLCFLLVSAVKMWSLGVSPDSSEQTGHHLSDWPSESVARVMR